MLDGVLRGAGTAWCAGHCRQQRFRGAAGDDRVGHRIGMALVSIAGLADATLS